MAATAGRTTLMGEGLQHQDGHSLVLASTVPAVQAYDPAFAYEVGAIVQAGIDRMYGGGPADWTDVFYYITLYNENYEMPVLPDVAGLAEQIVEGIYKLADAPEVADADAGHDPVLGGLAQGALARRPPSSPSTTASPPNCGRSRRTRRCARTGSPPSATTVCTRAASSGSRSWPSASRRRRVRSPRSPTSWRWCPSRSASFVGQRTFTTLGTDGMGRSDTREALRRLFEIDTGHVVVAVLSGLLADGDVDASVVEDAIARYDIDPDAVDPWSSYTA